MDECWNISCDEIKSSAAPNVFLSILIWPPTRDIGSTHHFWAELLDPCKDFNVLVLMLSSVLGIPYVFLFSCILEPLQALHFTLFTCKPRRSVWSSLFFRGVDFFFLFEDPQAKYNTKNAGKYIAKKGSRLPSFMTNAMRKFEGLSVVCLNMSPVTLSLRSICLHNQSCMFCAIWPHFARTPTVSHTTKP